MSTLKHPFATVEFREDKIIHIHYNSLLISLDNTKELIATIRENNPWKLAPIYISSEAFANHEIAAQKYLASKEIMNQTSAVAILVENTAQKIGVNFFMRTMKPTKPTRFFNKQKEAIAWLRMHETIAKI